MPLFTIGVTTYRRPEMLRECLTSLVEQTFADFEVLVGNDYVPGPIVLADLGIFDPRIRVLNYEKNKGELNNMNFMLTEAKGEYFTWLADDDFMSVNALAEAARALKELGNPRSVLPYYKFVFDFDSVSRDGTFPERAFFTPAAGFLLDYFKGKHPIAGCYGFFRTTYLQKKGGMRQLGVGYSPYSDNLLAVEEATDKEVAILPFVTAFIRRHGESISTVARDIVATETAQRQFVAACRTVFTSPHLTARSKQLNRSLARLCLYDFFSVVQKSGRLSAQSYGAASELMVRFRADPAGFLKNVLLVMKLSTRVLLSRLRKKAA